MSPSELGDTLARLVWESFSDHIADGEAAAVLTTAGVEMTEDVPDERRSEELLIFFMWAHTRGVQLAFHHRAPEERIREALDAMHRAVFEDMVAHGTPSAQLPVLEQRVSARYAEYHEAAKVSDSEVGRAVLAHLTGGDASMEGVALRLAERAVSVAGPLRDFLEEVDLRA